MKKKKYTKTICFKTTLENYNYLKMSGNVNKKLNALVKKARLIFEEYQQELLLDFTGTTNLSNTS